MKALIALMRRLRGKEGCPWDRKQSLQSLRRCVLEEACEVIEAIGSKDSHHMEEELGDLLVVIAMLIVMGEEKKLFSQKSILKRATQKMIHRHPHVFGSKKARTAEEALGHWNQAKVEERKQAGQKQLLLGLKSDYPALLLAYKVQRRVARVGFDWDHPESALSKIEEELGELKRELRKGNRKKVQEELGDFLFSTVNLARKLQTDPEIALRDSVSKFKRRFAQVEKQVQKSGKDWEDFNLKELDQFWERAKKIFKSKKKY